MQWLVFAGSVSYMQLCTLLIALIVPFADIWRCLLLICNSPVIDVLINTKHFWLLISLPADFECVLVVKCRDRVVAFFYENQSMITLMQRFFKKIAFPVIYRFTLKVPVNCMWSYDLFWTLCDHLPSVGASRHVWLRTAALICVGTDSGTADAKWKELCLPSQHCTYLLKIWTMYIHTLDIVVEFQYRRIMWVTMRSASLSQSAYRTVCRHISCHLTALCSSWLVITGINHIARGGAWPRNLECSK